MSKAEPAKINFREGDVLASKGQNVSVSKILKIERTRGGDTTFHMWIYQEEFTSLEDARHAYLQKQLHVLVMHAPVDGAAYNAENTSVLGHDPVTDDELEGYRTFLEMCD